MKYVVIRVEMGEGLAREVPIIFPDGLTHADVAEGLMFLGCPELKGGKVVAAGFLSSTDLGAIDCHGRSITCGVSSREETDNALIRGMDYFHGLVE